MAKRRGRAREELVAAIERALVSDPDAKITSPGRLRHRVTKKMREVDVLIVRGKGRHKSVTAVECKDWNRPVDDPVIEQWAKKCSSLQVNKGIIVSSGGFTPEALIDAEHEGISCLSLNDVQSFDWLARDAAFTHYERRKNFAWTFDLGEANSFVKAMVIVDSGGNQVPINVLNAQAAAVLDRNAENAPPKDHLSSVVITFDHVEELRVCDTETQTLYPIVKAMVRVEFDEVELQRSLLRLHEYVDHQTGECHQIAQNEFEMYGRKARLMIVPNDEGGRTVKLVFDPVSEQGLKAP